MKHFSVKVIFMKPHSGIETAEALITRARELLPSLSVTEQRLLQIILAGPDDVPSLSITELAEHGSCSEATVVRLCQSLGLRGYGELRLTLARRQATHIDLARGPIRGDEADHDVLVKTLGQAAQLLESVATHVSERVSDDFVRAVDALENAKDVLVIGIGASAAIAQDAAHQFQTIGLRAYAPADPFAQQFEAGRLGAGSVCFIVSHTGATEPVLRCAEIAGRAGATRVAVSSYRKTPLEAESDALLVAGGMGPSFKPEAATNRIAHLLLVDALVNAIILRRPARSAQALEYLHAVATGNQI